MKTLKQLCEKHGIVYNNVWQRYKGQKLYTKDLILFRDSGLAFIDSSLSTMEPDRFMSMPEAWSFGDFNINRRTAGKQGFAHVRKNGWVYRDTDWLSDRVNTLKWDKIEYFMRIGNGIYYYE